MISFILYRNTGRKQLSLQIGKLKVRVSDFCLEGFFMVAKAKRLRKAGEWDTEGYVWRESKGEWRGLEPLLPFPRV